MSLVVITVEKVPRKLLEVYKDLPACEGNTPRGMTLSPTSTKGFRKLEVLIQEKMGKYETRMVLAHELFHCLQHLTGCELDEKNNNEIDVVMAAALKEKRKKKAGQCAPYRKH